jgi:RNA polymerase sigma-70 factor, ECF subfamily
MNWCATPGVPGRGYAKSNVCRADRRAACRHDGSVQTERTTADPGRVSRGGEEGGTSDRQTRLPAATDVETRRWIQQLQEGHPKYHETVAALHSLLRRAAVSELSRRRRMLFSISGPEFDDLAQQAADDALVDILAKLDQFSGRCRFTTWVYKFAIYEVAGKVARHAWRRHRPALAALDWDQLVCSELALPEDHAEQRAQLETLSAAIRKLADRQRTVFVAVALNDVPIDVLAIELRTNRNAIYKSLFDARQRLRADLAAAGHPLGRSSGHGNPAARADLCTAA